MSKYVITDDYKTVDISKIKDISIVDNCFKFNTYENLTNNFEVCSHNKFYKILLNHFKFSLK